ncbi:MAG: isoamylase early set domain-containing protein [Persicimonas sp.]
MIKKQRLKSRPVCKLTFEIPKDIEADEIELMGDFTDWEPVPFKRLKSGKWKIKQDVGQDGRYEFRYRIKRDGEVIYENDPDADGYVPNEFGTENGIIECE